LTRRAKRARAKHQLWVDKVSEAAGMDFEEASKEDLTPQQVEEAVFQQAAEVKPTTRPPKSKEASSRYTFSEEGKKIRKKDSKRTAKNESMSKA